MRYIKHSINLFYIDSMDDIIVNRAKDNTFIFLLIFDSKIHVETAQVLDLSIKNLLDVENLITIRHVK